MFRRRLKKKILLCFYCNTQSTIEIERDVPLRKWHCAECDQTNYLDENGEIADYVPPEGIAPAPPLRPSSPPSLGLSSPFCDTCISNQTLVMKNLASFLPPEDHSDYDTYAAALPAYQAELEVKYPPVCTDCEEHVRARLQRNNYLAKTSALGGFLKKRRMKGEHLVEWSLVTWIRFGIWIVRGALWWVTSIVYLSWCLLGFLRPELVGARYRALSFGENEPFRISLPSFLDNLSHFAPTEYVHLIPRYVAYVSPFVVMWDYKWLQVHRIPGSHVEGIWEYRELQFIILIARFVTWGLTQWTKDAVLTMWISGFLGIISVIALVWSYGILKVKLPPEIALLDSDEISPQTTSQPSPPYYPFERTVQTSPSRPSPPQSSLDISNLGISERPPRLPLPPYKEDSTMDWTPSPQTNTFSPKQTSYSSSSSIFASGKGLPPPPGTTFPITNRIQNSKQVEWFKPSQQTLQTGNITPRQNGREIELAEQRFFAKQEATGLESLLGQALRLDDEPTLVRAVKSMKRSMERDERVKKIYLSLGIYVAGIIPLGTGFQMSGIKDGVAWMALCIGPYLLIQRSLLTVFIGLVFILVGGVTSFSRFQVLVPFHPVVSRLYTPIAESIALAFASVVENIALAVVLALWVFIIARDIASLVNLRLESVKKRKQEEEERQQKLKGIFYTPTKPTGKAQNANFNYSDRARTFR